MEEDICILISDLSGYTAHTEIHGAISSADLIDKYIAIVQDCLVGDSHLQERVGDEVMIVSYSSDNLLATAVAILNTTAKGHNFLQVHGGLHFGKVFKGRESFFGSSINLTSRIAAKAHPGTFWCSKNFVDSLSNPYIVRLKSMGEQNFKNITENMELYELRSEDKSTFFIDSICRMLILDTGKAVKHPTIEDIFFCSTTCRDIYLKNQLVNFESN